MSVRSVFVVILAIVCGVSAAMGVSQLRRTTQVEVGPETVPVVVAKADISRGRMITGDDVKLQDYPKKLAPENSITKTEDAVDHLAAMAMVAGELILNAKLVDKNAGRGLAALIPSGMRAYTIQTSRIASSVAGFVMPGNRVDVLLNLRGNQNDASGGGSTTTLLQSVEILAVDQRLDAPSDNKVNPKDLSSVTLLVTPRQAALLDLGQNLGQLTFSLRNPNDGNQAVAQPATLADIRFRQEKPFIAPTDANPKLITQYDGMDDKPGVYKIVTLRGNHRGFVPVTSSH